MTRRRKIIIAVPLVAVGIVALFAVAGLVGRGGGSSGSSSASTMEPGRVADQMSLPTPLAVAPAASSEKSLAAGSGAKDYSAAIPPATAPSAHYLVRNGDLSLLVARGTILSAGDRIKAMTAAMGGYVMSSSIGTQSPGGPEPMPADTSVDPLAGGTTSGGGSADGNIAISSDAQPYASLVVRVPEQFFDTAIKRFSKLGPVQSASTSSDDVTSQFVDLQARLRHYRAVERRLVSFLQQTHTVNQMLAVQDRIDSVQLTIEELTAQLKSMRETTTYGTLSLYVTEKDANAVVIHESNTFGGTFWNSILLLGRGARVTALVLTALVPFIVVFGLIGLVVWYIVRRVRRSRRQPAQPTLPA